MQDVKVFVVLANGYGVSVVRNKYSYGGADGLFEIAILRQGKLTTIPGVNKFDDPVGHLNAEEVAQIIEKIAAAV